MAFWKKNKKEENKNKGPTPEEFKSVNNISTKEEGPTTSSTVLPKEYGVLKGFYVSEKATALSSFNQYVFKVFDSATKNEIKKQVDKNFGVKVKEVKVINLPRKNRTIGRHVGFKKGFKKAIVVLEKGYAIEQAKV